MTNTMVRKNGTTISRRDFLKLGGAAFGALAIGQFIPPLVAQAAREAGYLDASRQRLHPQHVRDVRVAMRLAG